MHNKLKRLPAVLIVALLLASSALASAYNARPKLVVVFVVDQLREDVLERYHDQLTEGGFRLILDRGAWFTNCNYEYANTRTAPGHATLGTGSYTVGHGIMSNGWYDPVRKRNVQAVEDENTTVVGASVRGSGSSPRNLLTSTFADELKLATGGQSRVFGIALKDRAAILPVGFAADGAFWLDRASGLWVTSSYYMKQLPAWAAEFNSGHRAEKYLNLTWKDADGKTLRTTVPQKKPDGTPVSFYDTVGPTPFANDYEFEFARELFVKEKLGTGKTTDLLSVSISSHDILGHKVGPDSAEERAMLLALDRQLAEFFAFIGRQIGLANVTIAITADHGSSPLPAYAASLRLPAANVNPDQLETKVNAALSARLGRRAEYIRDLEFPVFYLSEEAFGAVNMKEAEAERAVGNELLQSGFREFFTKSQLASGDLPPSAFRRRYFNSYSPYSTWYVMGLPGPFVTGSKYDPVDHSTPFSYDTHVPLGLYGLSFRAGQYRSACEPVDLASTLSSLLGVNPPASAMGRVLTEAFADSPTPSRTKEQMR
ncbi:MAG TPA: alkaline phosphatase family protein [Clostridia bacterium]|nr:alkaline phosphatase family protein [Clostridia bacterium]